MNKFSLFTEGMMSILCLLPATGHSTPNYIKPNAVDIKKVSQITSHESWMEVGLTMRQVANAQLENLPNAKQNALKATLS